MSKRQSPTHFFLIKAPTLLFVFCFWKLHLDFIYTHFRQNLYKFITLEIPITLKDEAEAASAGGWAGCSLEREGATEATKAGRGDGGGSEGLPWEAHEDLQSSAESRACS